MKDILKKLLAFAIICFYALGTIGGTAYLFHFGQGIFGFAVLALSAMAFPTAMWAFCELTGDNAQK